MKEKIEHIFFDLDRTLWDFEKSAEQAFEQIYSKFELAKRGVQSVAAFHAAYTIHNNFLWDQYRNGVIEKEVLRGLRFRLTLADFGIIDDELGEKIGDEYVRISPLLVNLFPYSIEILDYLFPLYKLHVITNGFSEVQETKLKSSGMDKYFGEVITSEEAGVKKPHPDIFKFAFNKVGASSFDSIMIGDDYEVDIVGARDVDMKQIFFDPDKKSVKNGSTYYINCLKEIEGIL